MILPTNAVIPIHGIIQSGAGIIRAIIFRRSIVRKVIFLFFIGTLIGYGFSIHFLIALPEYMLKLILGLGIIILNLLPKLKFQSVSNSSIIIIGTITGFLTMFIGVMGPIIATFLLTFMKQRHIMVGTFAWCMALQNIGKTIIFGSLGFDYLPWVFLILILIISSYIGTILGKRLLDKSNDVLFKKMLKITIITLGSKLIYDAFLLY